MYVPMQSFIIIFSVLFVILIQGTSIGGAHDNNKNKIITNSFEKNPRKWINSSSLLYSTLPLSSLISKCFQHKDFHIFGNSVSRNIFGALTTLLTTSKTQSYSNLTLQQYANKIGQEFRQWAADDKERCLKRPLFNSNSKDCGDSYDAIDTQVSFYWW